jgi:hypothetical protein
LNDYDYGQDYDYDYDYERTASLLILILIVIVISLKLQVRGNKWGGGARSEWGLAGDFAVFEGDGAVAAFGEGEVVGGEDCANLSCRTRQFV